MTRDRRTGDAGPGGGHDENADVDFVVGEDEGPTGNNAPTHPSEPAAHGASPAAAGAESLPGHDARTPWLRRHRPVAVGLMALVVVAIGWRVYATQHGHARQQAAPSSSVAPPGLVYTSPAPLGVNVPPPAKIQIVPGECTYGTQRVTVHALPAAVTTTMSSLLPGIAVQASTTGLGRGAVPSPCVVERDIVAADHGVTVEIDIRPVQPGDHDESRSSTGSLGVYQWIDVVTGDREVHISVHQPYEAQGSSALNVGTLTRLAADPKLTLA